MKRQSKNQIRIGLLVSMLLLGMLAVAGCEKKTAKGTFSFLEASVSVEKHETYELKLVGCEAKEVKWKSENPDIATVQEGIVCANQKGRTKIYAGEGDGKISCEVVVTDNQYVPILTWKEAEGSIRIKEGESYVATPSLTYNGNTYTDVTYTYKGINGMVEVAEDGTITGKKLGSDVVCVEAKWRNTTVTSSLQVDVVDVSTAIEVGDNHFEIYLHGEGKEWPDSAEIGTTVYEKNQVVENPGDSVLYVEKAKEGDVEGAAIIKGGKVYGKKLGTTHFLAQYQAKNGETYHSAEFEVSVEQTPADLYMTNIRGKEFEFFWEPLSPDNSTEWDESKQAFHLKNAFQLGNDGRAFIINREYFNNILKYTKAESISFEVMTDGIASGYVSDDASIYHGYYPDTWSENTVVRESIPTKWQKIEISFKDIPKDEEGNAKTIYIMNTLQGMYIRNVTLWLPGEDRTGYDPNHDYMEEITGKKYEFFIEALDGANSVTWDKKEKAYHLKNQVTKQSDGRGFIFNRDYFYNIMKHTDAESISFEFRSDGKKSGLKTDDKTIYQGFYPDWWDADYVTRYNVSEKWTKVEIYFKDIPKDEEGMKKTVFLMNTVAGMYVRNITLYKKGEDRTNYDKTVDYMADIEGKEYEFFIEALGSDNTVKWDGSKQAFHLINKEKKQSDSRGFIFNRDYFTNIMRHTDAESIVFEVMTDGQKSGCPSDDNTIYQGFYPDWWHAENVTRYNISNRWTKIEIFLKDVPKDEKGEPKTVFLMNAVEGMYVRNMKLYKKGEDRTDYDKSHNYMEPIQGADYEFFIEPLGAANSVVWEKDEKAYHLINKEKKQGDSRGFVFNLDYLNNIREHTKAESISFEIKHDGSICNPAITDKTIYQGFYPNWWDNKTVTRYDQSEDWTKVVIRLADIPKDEDGNYKTIFLMNASASLYVRNITLELPKAESGEDGKEEEIYDPDHNYLEDISGTAYESFFQPLSSKNKATWEDEKEAFHITNTDTKQNDTRGVLFDKNYITGILETTDAISISFEYTSDGIDSMNGSDDRTIYQGFYPNWWDVDHMTRTKISEKWTKAEIFFDQIPKDGDGNLKSIFLMNAKEGLYIRKIKVNRPVTYRVAETLDLTAASNTWSKGNATGLTGGNGFGTYANVEGIATLTDCRGFSVHKVTFGDSKRIYTEDMKLRFKIKATPNKSEVNFLELRLFNQEATGGMGDSSKAGLIYKFTTKGQWETVEVSAEEFLDSEGHFKGFSFGLFGIGAWNSGENYTLELDKVEVLERVK